VVLALVALACLVPIYLPNGQDASRLELTRSIALHGSLEIPSSVGDRAVYHGRSYTDKAPGMSFLALPVLEVERLAGKARPPTRLHPEADLTLWFVRVATGGVFFMLGVWLVGRGSDELEPGTGPAVAAIYATGTLAGALAASLFGHVTAGTLGFAAFLLARHPSPRRALAAGGLAGLAVVVEYQAALLFAAVLVTVALRAPRRLVEFALGALPPIAVLAVYNALAFGSPFHLSYRYVANEYAADQERGLFGIGIPSADGLREVLVGNQGLLVLSPVLVAAAAGLWLLWRRGDRLDAAVIALVTLGFVVSDAGYFLPYGGSSPGPRFLVPALPFLAIGLAPALGRWPRTTLTLAVVSVVLSTANLITWSARREHHWLPARPFDNLVASVWSWYGLNRILASALIFAAALAALAVAAQGLTRRRAACGIVGE
jgi:hypothetical protein